MLDLNASISFNSNEHRSEIEELKCRLDNNDRRVRIIRSVIRENVEKAEGVTSAEQASALRDLDREQLRIRNAMVELSRM